MWGPVWLVSVTFVVALFNTGIICEAQYASTTLHEQKPCTWIKEGHVCGEVLKSRAGRDYASFRGIPYAQPPIGKLRFSNPVPADSWKETFNAIADAPTCIQKNYLFMNPKVEGQEDCLYLNVYSPQISTANKIHRPRYPVLVFIHGGGWFAGAGSSYMFGPEFFLDENVVLVTFNYRLGPFGFLSTSDDAAPGNWGLKDMTVVLQWVQRNINSFGGNPESVTIFGQSAGAGSVHYLMLSPQTKGLFHKVIAQSGSALNTWATPIDSIQIARAQASFVGCPANITSNEIVDCLRKVDASVIVNSGDRFKFWSIDPVTVYIPSIEKKTAKNPNPIVCDYPRNLIKNGRVHHVPFMLGVMENEGIIRADPIITQPKLRVELNARWKDLGPQIFYLPQSVNDITLIGNLWKNITDFYMKGNQFVSSTDVDSIQNFINLYSDRSIIYGAYQSAVKHAALSQLPVYFYKINFAGRDTWSNLFSAGGVHINFVFNKSHCDELNWMFRIPLLFPEPFAEGSLDLDISKKFIKMWTHFAATGEPAKFWTPVQNNKFNYLDITGPETMSMRTDFLPERMKFWNNMQIIENS